jgi:RNA polymerase sigma-70 factor (sigma-E family)
MVRTVQVVTETGVGVATTRDRDVDFAAYMTARQPSLLRTAYLLTGDRHTAEDLVQTAFAKLYLSWDKVQRRELVDAYVRRILVNEHTSLWRRAWKRRETSTDEPPEQQSLDRHDHGEGAALWEFVQTLPRRQRAVIVLRYYEDLSEAEIADALGISVGTVKSQASRALAAMRSRIHDHPELSVREEER